MNPRGHELINKERNNKKQHSATQNFVVVVFLNFPLIFGFCFILFKSSNHNAVTHRQCFFSERLFTHQYIFSNHCFCHEYFHTECEYYVAKRQSFFLERG